MKTVNLGYTVNVVTSTIVLTKEFAKKAGIIGTDEYIIFQELRNNFPKYRVKFKTIAKKSGKNTYKGLTIPAMEAFVENFHSDKMDELAQIEKLATSIHTNKYAYIKKWFLMTFKDYQTEGLPVDEKIEMPVSKAENKPIAKEDVKLTAVANQNVA